MKYVWKDLPEKLNCFTIRNAAMVNLNTGKIVRHYSANTKIVVVQKCVTPDKTYYRTADACHNYLNYAFEASAFGLPNENAPSAPSAKINSHLNGSKNRSETRTLMTGKKQTESKQTPRSNDGEGVWGLRWVKKILRRKHGNTKNP